MQHTNNTIKEMQSAVIGSIGRLAGGLGLIEIGRQSIMLASDLQEVQNVVDTTFGQGADTINRWSQTALKSFGLSELQAKQFNGTMGALLKSSGISSDKLLDMSTALSGLSADFASFYNLDPAEAFDKIKSGISGETEPLKSLGINMSVANLEAYALTKGINKQWKEMSQAEQVQLRYNYLMEMSKDAQGDFAKTSKGFANQLRIAKETLKQVGATIASYLLPFLNQILIKFNDLLAFIPGIIDGFKNMGSGLQDTGSLFGKAYILISNFISGVIENSMRIGKDLVAPFETAFNSISGFVKTVAGYFLDLFSSVSQNNNMVDIFNVIRDVLGGLLSDITGVFNFLNDNWSTIAPIIMGVASSVLFFNGAMKVIAITTQVVTALQVAWQGVTMACNIAMGLLNGTIALTPLGWITILIGGFNCGWCCLVAKLGFHFSKSH